MGEAKSVAPRSSVERSGDRTQRKAAGSAWLGGQCGHRDCGDERTAKQAIG
jgi:hypothetical protein